MDFLDEMDKEYNLSEEATKVQENKEDKPKKSNTDNKNNLWNKTDFNIKKIDTTKFNKSGSHYAWYGYYPEDDLTDSFKNMVKVIFNGLNENGYIFRHNQASNNNLINDLINQKDFSFESYLPWKNFNAGIENAIMNYGNEKGYSIAAGYFKTFGNLPPTIRAVKASMVHSLLGKECDNPVDFILVYTETGDDKFHKDFKFAKNGDLAFIIKICKDANIPLFNIKNPQSLKNFKEFMK